MAPSANPDQDVSHFADETPGLAVHCSLQKICLPPAQWLLRCAGLVSDDYKIESQFLRLAILSTANGCLMDAIFSWCIMGKSWHPKPGIVQILHRNTCHRSICQYNRPRCGTLCTCECTVKYWFYNKSCIYPIDHIVNNWAVFSIISHSLHLNPIVTGSLMPTTVIKI